MKDKEIVKYIKDLLPFWRAYKMTDSISELHELSMKLFSKFAKLMEDIDNDN